MSWLLLAIVLVLAGLYLHVRLADETLSYLVAGIGAGIGLALLGSIIHDAFAGQRTQH
ncbi:MAG TPA: hypothetical protein VIJ03_03200 [Candidatus Dormibacteraeota bacterium]